MREKRLPVSLSDGSMLKALIPGGGPDIVLSLNTFGNMEYSEHSAFINQLGIDEKYFILKRVSGARQLVGSVPERVQRTKGKIPRGSAAE